MQVNPDNKRFGDIHELTPKAEALFAELAAEGKIIARADSEDALKKLQDDLRKADYRRIFDK